MTARLSAALLLCLVIAPDAGTPSTRALDASFARLRDRRVPAAAMVVVQHGRVVYARDAGYADLEHGVRASATTRFDWASVAKQFTAYGVSLLVEQKRLSLDDDVRRWLPELDLGGARITIRQLIHHTTGLEDGDGLLVLAGWRPGEPVRHADLARLLVRQQHLRFAPGTQHGYSNGGYSLLVEIIQRATGQSFAAFSDSAVFRPLGLSSTQFVDGPSDMVPQRALPYWPREDGTLLPSTQDLYPGAGGLFASTRDVARWMMHAMAPRRDTAATRRLFALGRLANGDTLSYAWGLVRRADRRFPMFVHGGSGPATAAQLIMIPDLEFGVVAVTAGETGLDPSQLAREAVEAFVGEAMGPAALQSGPRMLLITDAETRVVPPESRGIHPSRGEMERLVGNFRLPDSSVLSIRRSAETLEFAYGAHAPWMPLHPLGDGRFVRVPWWEVLSAVGDTRAPATALRVERTPRSIRRTGDSVQYAPRIATRVFDAASAAPFVGLYYSDELGALYEVRRAGEQLVLRHARHGDMSLTALGEARFAVEGDGIVGVRFTPGERHMAGLELEARSWGVTAGFRWLETGGG